MQSNSTTQFTIIEFKEASKIKIEQTSTSLHKSQRSTFRFSETRRTRSHGPDVARCVMWTPKSVRTVSKLSGEVSCTSKSLALSVFMALQPTNDIVANEGLPLKGKTNI